MCLEYLGTPLTEAAIAGACATRARGTTLDEALAGLERLGFTGEKLEERALEWLHERLAESQPVIVSLLFDRDPESGTATLHGVVVIGADDQHVEFHDPQSGPNCALPREEFPDRWDLTGRKALLVQPG